MHQTYRTSMRNDAELRKNPKRLLPFLSRASIYKLFLPRTVRILRRYRPRLAPRVILITPNLIVKYGSTEVYSEACAIDFISKNTTIPVPKLVTVFQVRDGTTYILMTRCSGVPLQNVIRQLSQVEKQNALAQLRGYVDQLRALEPPQPGKVGSIAYGPLEDDRICDEPCGPFGGVAELHKAMRLKAELPSGHEECDKLITMQDRRDYDIKCTHGDLSLRHVHYLDGKITGIIDWESAGWLPDYWEYTMTWDAFWDASDLRDDIATFLDPFPEELKMERTRMRLFRGRG
ncbi:hypothetical protein CIHG_00195 [Coccidioides immitis H538.4]|nr:hypothetical protein CIRG_07014 [Coccidioides immitis RMSCC 2394]KMU82412.1 hypothetical protein CIHG_00195 [Coccidioides immitis H538.4]